MRGHAKRLITAALIAATAATLAACGGSAAGHGRGGRVQIGALYSLTGEIASAGLNTLHGTQLAARLINGSSHAIDLPLVGDGGLPRLGHAKLEVVPADAAGVPETGARQVQWLVRSKHVAAIVGGYRSSVTLAASAAAEQLEVPFVNAASTAVSLTQRGLRWFFRVTPTDRTFATTFMAFLARERRLGKHVKRIAVLHTSDAYGSDGAAVTRQAARRAGLQTVADVGYDSTTSDLAAQVEQIRSANPDVLFVLSYTNDAILLIKTMHRLAYEPPALLAYGAGFADPAFLRGAGGLANGAMTRASWSLQLAQRRPTARAVAALFKGTYGEQMNEDSARSFTATMALAEAINDAGSTDPGKIRRALRSLSIPGSQTIMPWAGIKFDSTGQNVKASGVVEQLLGGSYRVVYPGGRGTSAPVWPMSKAEH